MVRGLCPRDCIRGVVNGGGRGVGGASAVGHAEQVRLTRPGGHVNAGRRGRRPLRAVQDVGIRIVVNGCANAADFRPPLGSPERGAVAARRAVTEGLGQGGCGVIKLPVNRRRAGVEVGCQRGTGAVRQPTAANRGRCALRCAGNVSALQLRRPLSEGRGVGDAAPYGLCEMQVSAEREVQFITPVTFCAASPVTLSPVRGGVLDAPPLRDWPARVRRRRSA